MGCSITVWQEEADHLEALYKVVREPQPGSAYMSLVSAVRPYSPTGSLFIEHPYSAIQLIWRFSKQLI